MASRCPQCRGGELRPTLARVMVRCPQCAWEGFPIEPKRPALGRIPPRSEGQLAGVRPVRRDEDRLL